MEKVEIYSIIYSMSRSNLDKTQLQTEISAYLSRHGATPARALCDRFKISQPTLSRIFSKIKDKLLIIGKAQETKYALHRKIDGVTLPIPIYEILENSSSRRLGLLHALQPQGFYFESQFSEIQSSLYLDLPYFLNDLRPSGFLGRLIPTLHADLELPSDIRLWTAEHCLKFLTARAWNSVGNFIVGEKAFQLYLENCQSIQNGIKSKERAKYYLQYANDVLSIGDAGSSAAGEQPKFITLLLPKIKHVIVKFSPPLNTKVGTRVADLLISESIALTILKQHGQAAANAEVIIDKERVFLEIQRFDRVNGFGRRGLISLLSLDMQFSGTLSSWSKTAAELIKQKILPASCYETIRFRELFGELIGNNDMHLANFSFFTEGLQVTGPAPVYDMLPMLFIPRGNEIIDKPFDPKLPLPEERKCWSLAYAAAIDFWTAVLNDARISAAFKQIAAGCKNKIVELNKIIPFLPSDEK